MPVTATSRVLVEITAPGVRIKLINSPLNVIDLPMAQELQHALAEIEVRSDISTILFEGDGNAFSAGVDIKAHLPEQVHEMLRSFHAVIRPIAASRKATSAAGR